MILVTGGSGLLGTELIAQLLSKGENVTAIYNKTPLANFHSTSLKQFYCNILDTEGLQEIMEGVEQVYHCAAIVSFDPAMKNELFKINIEGTANIVNAALDAGVKRMLHVSSVAALGRINNKNTVDETMIWTQDSNPGNYAKSKYLGELEVWRGIGEGLEAVIVNPVIILGTGNWNSGSSQMFKTAYDEFPWFTEGVNGFVDVRDVAAAMILLMESGISGERFVISAENKSYREILDLMAAAFGKRKPHKKATALMIKLIWRIEAAKSFFTRSNPLITKETAANALTQVYFDNSRLRKFLPSFQYRTIEESIRDACTVFQQKINND